MLLFMNAFVSPAPTVLVFAPVFLPVYAKFKVDSLRFNVVVICGLYVKTVAPPIKDILFAKYGMKGMAVRRIVGALLPFFITVVLILVVIACIPTISRFLPQLGNCV